MIADNEGTEYGIAVFRYETNIKPANVETGAKPKLAQNSISLALQTLISQEDDCIYHSDEDIPFGEEQPGDQEKVVGLSPIGTPNWSGE